MTAAYELRVCMDIGSQSHQVAIGLSSGEILGQRGQELKCHFHSTVFYAIFLFHQKI
jgi:hypothetical protein